MANPAQCSASILRRSFGLPAFALALFCALTIIATQSVQAQTFTVLHTFSGGADGATPLSGVTMDRAGNLYGMAWYGGYYGGDCGDLGGCGTAFKMSPHGSGWSFNVLYTFQGGYDGAIPDGEVLAPNGLIYGLTGRGGIGDCDQGTCGTAFKLSPPTSVCKSVLCPWTETVLYRFNGTSDGAIPVGNPIFDGAGNLYGATRVGGLGWGTVFELTPSGSGWTESVLYPFTDGNDGAYPQQGVIFDSLGNLDGTAAEGGASSVGTVFQLSPSQYGWNETSLYQFNTYNSGEYPSAPLLDVGGVLYGTTNSGGTGGCGTVFQLTTGSGGQYTVLYNFSGCGGEGGPDAGLIMDSAGNLYGTTIRTGAYNDGVVFKLTSAGGGTWTYTSLHDFTGGSDGYWPTSLIMDANGNLFGTSGFGGIVGCYAGCGVVWEITP